MSRLGLNFDTWTLSLPNRRVSVCVSPDVQGCSMSQEVKPKDIAVGIVHPGFNKTGMTDKYKEIWDKEGAVDPSVGA